MKKNFKQFLLAYTPHFVLNVYLSLKIIFNGDLPKLQRRITDTEQAIGYLTAASLLPQYHNQLGPYQAHGTIRQYESRIFSQNGEDGILLYLFSNIGVTNKTFVEFGVGNGKQCNSANLALNFGWTGLLMEIDKQSVKDARYYYNQTLKNHASRIQIQHCQVTAENINQLLTQNNIIGEIDLLSIDVDGNDYWIWQAIDCISPRIVVIEYNASLGSEKAITIQYEPNFNARKKHPSGFYHGASLAALTLLAEQKKYTLVGCDSTGVNAFFIRNDALVNQMKAVSVEQAYMPHFHRTQYFSPEEQFVMIKNMPFVNVHDLKVVGDTRQQ